jgi:hypothetical protein
MEFIILSNTKEYGSIIMIKPERFDIYAHICIINNIQD